MTLDLSRATLESLPAAIARPRFQLDRVRPGIVHLGLGGFHRAHMANYADALMQRDAEGLRWGVVGVGLRPSDAPLIAALAGQDRLYTLVERDEQGAAARVVGSLYGAIHAAHDTAEVLEAIDRPGIAIVSLTVTQAGYCIDNGSRRLDPDHPLIVHDRADPHRPQSAIGVLTAAFARRRAAGRPAFAALSCDNIQHNGAVLRDAVLDLAGRQDASLAAWIAEHAAFPGAMVDRITPLTTPADRAWLEQTHGIADACPVFCEPFSQWVIEDRFPAGRPAWEAVGAQLVDDVAPYEFMKLRLLNATHLAVAAPGQLMGLRYIDEAMRDEAIGRLAQALMARETGPTVPAPAGVDLQSYMADVARRFGNPTIGDTTERVNTDASVNYLLDPLRDCLAAGRAAPLLSFAVAAWIRRSMGRDDAGRQLAVSNPSAAALQGHAAQAGRDPATILSHRETFGDLSDHPVFRAEVGRWLTRLDMNGTAASLSSLLDDL